jgi:FkbM family methyltransferase
MPIVGGWAMPEADKYFEKFIPADGPLPKQNGFQREHLMAALEHVKAWNVALDVGAHVGFWTRDMAERFKKVYAFEASPDTFACLVKNTDDLPDVQTFNAAVGNAKGFCKIGHDPRRERAGNTGSRFVMPTPKGSVPMIPIDSLKLDACDFIKIDVEGFEFHVLNGAVKTIKKHRPTIIMECREFAGRYGLRRHSAELFLSTLGYKEVAALGHDKVLVAT